MTSAMAPIPAAVALGGQLAQLTGQLSPALGASQNAGDPLLDRGQIMAVNATGTAIGTGATQIAPYTCQLLYHQTVYYSVPWIGPTPAVGQVMVISQPPLLYVLGPPSNIVGAGTSSYGALLSHTFYQPTTMATYALTGSMAAIDTTNVTTIPFVVPASGNIRVFSNFFANLVSANAVPFDSTILVAFLNHTGGAKVTGIETLGQIALLSAAPSYEGRFVYDYTVTGLTPGATLQLDLAGQFAGGAGATATIYADSGGVPSGSGQGGPINIFVYSA